MKTREDKRMVKLGLFFQKLSFLDKEVKKKNQHIHFWVHGCSSWSTFGLHLLRGHKSPVEKNKCICTKGIHFFQRKVKLDSMCNKGYLTHDIYFCICNGCIYHMNLKSLVNLKSTITLPKPKGMT